jgi:hypothetical protein
MTLQELDERDAQMAAAYRDEGLSLADVGARFGLSQTSAYNRLLPLGVLRSKGEGTLLAAAREFERYKQERGLLDRHEVAAAVGCTSYTVWRHVGVLTAERMAGNGWYAKRGTWLFQPVAVDQLRALLQRRAGVDVECAGGCGHTRYVPPYLIERRPRFYCSTRCQLRDFTKRKLLPAGFLLEGVYRQQWARLRPRRRKGDSGEIADHERIAELAAQGLKPKEIANRLTLSLWQVYRSLKRQ